MAELTNLRPSTTAWQAEVPRAVPRAGAGCSRHYGGGSFQLPQKAQADIGGYGEREAIQIRLGESLLLTAGMGQTGAVQIAVVDSDNQAYRTCSGVAGARFPVLFDRAGVFTATAWVNDNAAGVLTVTVVQVDPQAPIACQIGYRRQKDVLVYGPTDGIAFTANDSALLEVGIKEPTELGLRLSGIGDVS